MKKRIIIALLCLCSCSKFFYSPVDYEVAGSSYGDNIPVEEALLTLDRFLSENYPSLTKSGGFGCYNNVSAYYKDIVSTKSSFVKDTIPTAYVVNFENNAGFAVLGARRKIPDVIAVVESGSINPLTLEVINNSDSTEFITQFFNGMDESEIDFFRNNVVVTEDSLLYSPTDEDYYVGGPADIDELAANFIRKCVLIEDDSPNMGGRVSTGSGGGADIDHERYATRIPLLGYSWSQGTPYNTYCKRGLDKQKQAYTGCSTTAMSMIVAYNEFPQTLAINGTVIDYHSIKSAKYANSLDKVYQNHVALLMGSIYEYVVKSTSENWTMITPQQIKERMEEFGYSDVEKTSGESLNKTMVEKISGMLLQDKPVFISAIPKGIRNWSGGHSWVVDGAKYSPNDTYLLHMNFGWHGYSNGYYAVNYINPADAESYDDISRVDTSKNYVYTWHYRILTYDVPTGDFKLSINL